MSVNHTSMPESRFSAHHTVSPASGWREPEFTDRTLALAIGALWLALALLSATQNYVLYALQGGHVAIWRVVAQSTLSWAPYAALTPWILRAGQRLPVTRRAWPSAVATHLALALLAGIPYSAVAAWGWRYFGMWPYESYGSAFVTCYLSGLPLMVLAYAGVHGLGRAAYWFTRSRAAELGTARLEKELAESRLAALQVQVHPHFLFNALNAVDTLVRDGNVEGATRVIYLLSDLLRESLDGQPAPMVRLGDELALVEKYLEIQRLRFPDRLHVSFDLAPGLLDVEVPAFVLQPLVENALRHAIEPSREAGRLAIRARHVEDGSIVLSVDDDGAGPPREPVATSGTGLRNLRARLDAMFGPGGSVELRPNEWGGASAVVTLPGLRPGPVFP